MKIVVTSNCQTGGVALALRYFFPQAVVRPFPLPEPSNTTDLELIRRSLADADYWVTSGSGEMSGAGRQDNGRLRVIRMPVIAFQAFHPDLCYARKKSTGELTTWHYNSAIGVWGYIQGHPVELVASLYSRAVFSELGYLDYWTSSKDYLRRLFANSDLSEEEFNRFFQSVQRRGVFMHSINHPKIDTLVDLTRLLALRIGYTGRIWDAEVELPDALLQDLVWPVYPEIGADLGIVGDYTWKMRMDFIGGVKAYLEWVYERYQQQGIARDDFEIVGTYHGWNYQKLDSVLSRHVEC